MARILKEQGYIDGYERRGAHGRAPGELDRRDA